MEPNGIDLLTDREREVLRLVHIGRSSKEIAISLQLSPNTVDVYAKRAMEKLGVRSRTQAALLLEERENVVTKLVYPPSAVATSTDLDGKVLPDEGDASFMRSLPFLRNGRRYNDLTSYQRLLWIALGAVLLMTLFAQLSVGINALKGIATGLTR